jgi:uncharacterized protein (TIGR02677 family)
LRDLGVASPRGAQPRLRSRDTERAQLAALMREESSQFETARARLATGHALRLSTLGTLDVSTFGLFLNLLGEALAEQPGPDAVVERHTGDGLFHVRLEPLGPHSRATIHTPAGQFSGRDHLITIRSAQDMP